MFYLLKFWNYWILKGLVFYSYLCMNEKKEPSKDNTSPKDLIVEIESTVENDDNKNLLK